MASRYDVRGKAATGPVQTGSARLECGLGQRGNDVQGVLIVIGGVFLAAMFFVLYIRAISAEHHAETLAQELKEVREGNGEG